MVGLDVGGGYEWKANGVVPRGVNVLEVDGQGLITSFESMWDGSRLGDDGLLNWRGPPVSGSRSSPGTAGPLRVMTRPGDRGPMW